MHERENTIVRHSSIAKKTMKMKPKISKKKNLLSCNIFRPDWNTLHRSKKKKTNSRASLLALYAARSSRDQLSLLSATVSPVARLALSPVLTVAVVRQLDNVVAPTV